MLSMILIGLAMQAAPAAVPASVPAKPAKVAGDPNKRICRSETATGSVMAKQVCRTRAEWASMGVSEGRDRDSFRDHSTNAGLPSLGGRPGS